ncbi:MAG: Crp/Fnr family transcriptional regulator [Gemmatimonadota bacterium]|nr:Crp/Fnr family transcriptional regulator [Gemmatimonadota bacterium]
MSAGFGAGAAIVGNGVSSVTGPLQNKILSLIPAAELADIMVHAEEIFCPLRQELFERGDTTELVYFPLTGMASLVIVMEDGTTIEAMTIGREGFIGFPLLNEVKTARYKGICQIEGNFLILNAKVFLSIIDSLPDLKQRLHRYAQFANESVAQSAACNSVHSIEQRCARWLLTTADAISSTAFNLTHEFLSQMLAVRRPGVTVAMAALARQSLVTHHYRKVTLIDVAGLKKVSCECYETIRRNARELLN